MKIIFKIFIILLFISSASKAETFVYSQYKKLKENALLKFNPPTEEGELKFSTSTYKGELKKGKANGSGTLTFSDGTKYVGQFKKNKIHGNGKYIDKDGNIISGKWRYGKITKKIDSKNREVIKLDSVTGKKKHFETRGTGSSHNLWFEAKPKLVDAKKLELASDVKVELDIFDTPNAFSPDYGDEDKLKEILAAKKQRVANENFKSSGSKLGKNLVTVYVITEKGKRDQASAVRARNNTSGQVNHGTGTTAMAPGSPGC